MVRVDAGEYTRLSGAYYTHRLSGPIACRVRPVCGPHPYTLTHSLTQPPQSALTPRPSHTRPPRPPPCALTPPPLPPAHLPSLPAGSRRTRPTIDKFALRSSYRVTGNLNLAWVPHFGPVCARATILLASASIADQYNMSSQAQFRLLMSGARRGKCQNSR